MASQYYNVTTNNGDAKIANAIATATKLNITHVVFGDGNGSVPTPDKSRTAMVNEVYRVAPSNYYLHPTIANRLIVEAIIPSDVGGFYIREVGLIADTTVLISDGSVAPIFKEASTDGTREYRLKFAINIVNSSIANITLDSSLIYVTQDTIVDNLTTADATKPLSAAQGKVLQDNKLNKTANAVSATKLQTARTIGGVSFDGSANINLPGVNAAGNQSTTGNAATATKLATARLIGGVSFDGTANINLPGVNAAGNQSTTGNAATATKLQTARTINGISFDGSANITIQDNTKALLTDFTNSKTEKGYQKLANGLILQWGTTSLIASSSGTLIQSETYPITFPTAVLHIFATYRESTGSSADSIYTKDRTNTGFNIGQTSSEAHTVSWFAIGY